MGERVGGVEPETVTCYLTWICEGCDACAPLDGSDRDEFPCTHDSPSVNGAWVVKAADHASALRSVEEELRQAREALREFRGAANRMSLLLPMVAVSSQRDAADEAVQSWRLIRKQYDAALSPVQGERRTQPEGESQMDDNNLNHLIGERDAEKWVDGFLTVVPDADRDLMLTWFACAIESGRMTVQGEHEQDGESLKFGGRAAARPWPGSGLPPGANAGCLAPGPCSCGLPKATLPPYGDRTASGGQGVRNDDSEATR